MDAPALILEIRLGPRRGKKAILRAGDTVSVGRTDLADVVVPEDGHLSPKHFSLRWDGAEAHLQDLHSTSGTQLDGEARGDSLVRHGAWIRAGDTDFTVHVEGLTPPHDEDDEDEEEEEEDDEDDEEITPPPFAEEPPPPDDDDEEMSPEDRAYLQEEIRSFKAARAVEQRVRHRERELREKAAARALPVLRAAAGEGVLHAVLDTARTPRILEVLREAVEEHRSLYEGAQSVALEEVAPYLVRMQGDSRLLAQLVREGWGKRWGIFLEGSVPQRELRRHLRRFLMVESERGEPLYFRFYDPGVLRDLWPTCSRRQLVELIGPLDAFLVEGEQGEVLRLTSQRDPG